MEVLEERANAERESDRLTMASQRWADARHNGATR
jgi:hypothetical protein